MRFKVDENLHDDVAQTLRGRGHDAETVYDEGLRAEDDATIAGRCRQEGRAIVTLDLDFANITIYPPEDYPGLIVLRVGNQSRLHVLNTFSQVLDLIDREPLHGHLWIVEEHRVRIRGASEQFDEQDR
jgi:predicted nuclease of predicted toxin-antitoxin system